MATCYLEVDDEITTAIGRLRAVTDKDAVLVVPAGSRIATSRINFKLLAREAAERHMNVAAVSDEPQVRALAISAGLPAYDSIRNAEQALATLRDRERRLNEQIRPTMPRQHPGASVRDPSATSVMPAVGAPDLSAPGDVPPAAQSAQAGRRARPKRRSRMAPVLVLGLLIVLMLAVGYGAYVYLPTATITIHPVAAAINAAEFTVTADPTVAVVDPANGVIPAQSLTVPVHVSGTFPATGVEARDIRAAGSVQFTSEDTLGAVPIPTGTIVSTSDGTQFATQEDATIPEASFETGPTQIDVDVKAVKGGTTGNVDAGTVTVVSPDLSAVKVTVTNPDAISGGKHVETQVVSQDDYDGAVASLTSQLQPALATALTDPANVPRGLAVYAGSAELGAAQPDQDATTVVGVAEASFPLGLDTTARVTAVDESLIEQVARARVQAGLQPGQKLVSDVSASNDGGQVSGETIVYRVNAGGLGYSDPSPQAILAAVAGKSVADARAALVQFGQADLSVWPDFIDHLPDQISRISVTVIPPTPAPTAQPTFPPSQLPPSSSLTPAPTPVSATPVPAAS